MLPVSLLEAGADPRGADKTGNTVLHIASQGGSLKLVKALMSKGADVNARTPAAAASPNPFRPVAGSQTPLMLAARAGHTDVLKALLEGGADPKLKASDGSTFLFAAVGSGNVDVVKFAYEYDPDVKVVTTSGSTLMHASVTGTAGNAGPEGQERVCQVIRFLAEKGAPLDELNKQGRTPMDIADILPIDKAVDLLTQLIAKSGVEAHHPSKR